jgi:hypothetical protein
MVVHIPPRMKPAYVPVRGIHQLQAYELIPEKRQELHVPPCVATVGQVPSVR